MTARRLVASLLLALALLLAGCTALAPSHVTVYAERTESEAVTGDRRTRTVGDKVGASMTYDFPHR